MKKQICDIEPTLWLDYLEDDFDKTLKSDLRLHASTCTRCRENLAEFTALNENLRGLRNRDVSLPSEALFSTMRSNIMAAVEKTQIENVALIKRHQIKIAFGATAAAFIVVFGSIFGPSVWNQKLNGRSTLSIQHPEDQLMVESAQNDLEVLGNVILNNQDADEMVLNATAEKLSGMSDREVRSKLDQLK